MNTSELHDVVQARADLFPAHPEESSVEEDVFLAREFGMKAGTHLQQSAHPAVDDGLSLARLGDAGKNLEERALPGAVASDDAECFSMPDLEGHVAQRPEDAV